MTVKEGAKFHLTPDEIKAFNDWEYRNAEGGRTPHPSKLTEEQLKENLQAIKNFSINNVELENRFRKIKEARERNENLKFSSVILILAIISVVLFFSGYVPFLIPLFLVLGYFASR